MPIPPKYEDVVANLDAALGREAALREELSQYEPASPGTASKRARWLLNIQDACKYGLPKHLVQRLNNTTKEIQNSIKYGGTKRLRDENESLQQRLTVAEQLLREIIHSGEWNSSALEFTGRNGFEVLEKIESALKQAAEPHKCIECESQYCHGVCVERGDDDERYTGAEGEGS